MPFFLDSTFAVFCSLSRARRRRHRARARRRTSRRGAATLPRTRLGRAGPAVASVLRAITRERGAQESAAPLRGGLREALDWQHGNDRRASTQRDIREDSRGQAARQRMSFSALASTPRGFHMETAEERSRSARRTRSQAQTLRRSARQALHRLGRTPRGRPEGRHPRPPRRRRRQREDSRGGAAETAEEGPPGGDGASACAPACASNAG